MNKLINYFRSDIGKKVGIGIYFSVTTIGFAGPIAYHGLLADKVMRVLQAYRLTEPYQMPENLTSISKGVIDKLQLSPWRKEMFQFYITSSIMPNYIGSIYLKKGGFIGLPIYMTYSCQKDIKKQEIKINHDHEPSVVPWNSEDGKVLGDSLILSEKAKKFIVAKELYYCTTSHCYIKSGILGSFFVGTFFLSRFLNSRLNLVSRSFAVRLLNYTIVTLFNFVLCISIKDIYTSWLDSKSDEFACHLGFEFTEGGLEYYSKYINRNKALRNMMGKIGDKLYTAGGNKRVTFRINYPLTAHKDDIQRMLHA